MPDPCAVWYSYSHSDFNTQEDVMSEQRRTGIILGEYKGLQVPGFDRAITDEDVMESLRRLQAQGITMDQYLSFTGEFNV